MCNFTAYTYYSSKEETFKEPCGLSSDECCMKAQSFGNGVNAYEIDDAGCCLLVSKSASSSLVSYMNRVGYLSVRAGSGTW